MKLYSHRQISIYFKYYLYGSVYEPKHAAGNKTNASNKLTVV